MVPGPDRHLIDIALTGLAHTKCRPLLVERPDSPMLYSRGSSRSDFQPATRPQSLRLDLRVGPIQKLEEALFSMSKATPHAKAARTPGGAASKVMIGPCRERQRHPAQHVQGQRQI
jgi:hypothetical protein